MNDTKARLIAAGFAWVPYLAVSWGYSALTDGTAKMFWYALGALLAARLFFSIIETLGSVLTWRVYGRRIAINRFLTFLRDNKFPQRKFAHDDIGNYLARIEDNYSADTALVKAAASELRRSLATFESMGFLVSMRMYSAIDDALELYSPKEKAPVFGSSAA
jgi:hypothetical protein